MAQDLEQIIKLLKDIQRTNNSNSESFDRLLTGINSKVNEIDKNSASAEFIRSYLTDLTKSFENKYSTTLAKFSDVEQALKTIFNSQDEHVKNKDMRELFDVFVKNLNDFYTESRQQKSLITSIESKISEIGTDKSDKEEIIRTISLLRKDFENLNNGYRDTIDAVSSDLKSVIASLIKLDQSAVTSQIQTQVEAMYKAINDIATYLGAIEKHEAALEMILANTATAEDIKVTQVSLDSIIERTREIISNLSDLADKSDVKALKDAAKVINDNIENTSTKEDITELVQKADLLSEKAGELKKSLADITKSMDNVLDKSALEDSLRELYTHLGEIQDDIIGTNVTGNVIELDNKLNLFSEDLSTIRNIVSDLNDVITEKIMKLLEEITFEDASYDIKTHISKLIAQLPQKEDVENLLNNQETGKKSISQIEKNTDELLDKLDNLPTHTDMEALNSNQSALIENLQVIPTKDDIENILSKTDEIEQMIDELNFDNEFSRLYDKSSSIETWLKDSEVREKSEEILAELVKKADVKDIVEIMKAIESMSANIEELSQNADAKKVNRTLAEVYQQIEDLKNDFINTTEMHSDSLIVHLAELQKTLSNIVSADEFDTFIEDLKTFTEKLTNYTDATNENFEEVKKFHDVVMERLDNVDIKAIEKLLDKRMLSIDNKLSNISEYVSNMLSNAVGDDVKNSIAELRQMLKSKVSEFDDNYGNKLSGLFDNYMTEVKNLLGKCENEFSKGILNQIKKLEDLVGGFTTSNNQTLSKILEKLEETGKAIEKTIDSGTIHSSIQEISELSERIYELGSTFKLIAQKDGDTKSGVVAVFLSEKLDELSLNMKDMSHQIENRLQAGFSYNSALIEEKTSALLALIKELRHENPQNIELYERLTVADNKLSDTKQELELVNTDVKDTFNQSNEAVLAELSKIKDMLEKSVSTDSNQAINSVKNELDKINDEVVEIVENTDEDNRNSIDLVQLEDSYKRISSELANNLRDFILSDIDSLIIKFDDLKYEMQDAIDRINPPKAEDMDDFKDFVQNINDFKNHQKTLIDNAVSKIENKIDDSNEKLTSIINLAINDGKIINAIDELKNAIFKKLSYKTKSSDTDESDDFASNSFEKEFEDNASQQLLPEIKEDFEKFSERIEYLLGEESEISGVLSSIKDKLAKVTTIPDTNETLDNFDILKALDYLKEDIENLTNKVDRIAQKHSVNVNDLANAELSENSKIELLNSLNIFEQIKDYIKPDEIHSVLQEINDKLEIISLSDESANLNEIKQILETVKNGGNSVTENPEILSVLKLINEKVDILASADNTEIFDRFEDTNDYLKLLNDKVDVLATGSFDEQVTFMLEELNEKVDGIEDSRQEIQEIKDLINTQSDYLKSIEKSDTTETLQKCLDELTLEVNSLSSEGNAEEIKKTVREMKESIMAAVVTVFDQISFAEESEDIKDFVEEKTDEINQNLSEVTSRLRQMTNSGEESDYTYSMQDIESDLAKMRLALNELQVSEQENSNVRLNSILENIHQISNSVEDLQSSVSAGKNSEFQEQIDKINSDLLNLNTLTNKLVVTSGASYDVITQNLNSKVDNVAKMIEKSHESDKVVRQALIYMGEWIDSTSENMNKITTNSEEIIDIKEALETLKNNIPEQNDVLNTIGEKFDEQQERLSFFEKQIAKLGNLEDRFDSQQERIDRLEMSLDKVLAAVQEIDDSRITKKIDKLDKQIAKLSTYVEKLAQYVE